MAGVDVVNGYVANVSLLAADVAWRRVGWKGFLAADGARRREILNSQPETRNPKPETRNPKPGTRNPKPETRKPTPEGRPTPAES